MVVGQSDDVGIKGLPLGGPIAPYHLGNVAPLRHDTHRSHLKVACAG